MRIGNAATKQFQLDIFGEMVGSLFHAHHAGIKIREADWRLHVALLEYLETKWQEPDEGIWEVRGARQNFTHSKIMAWVAFDRAVKLIEDSGFSGNHKRDKWKEIRDQIHREVCELGYNPKKKAFTQYYGAEAMDASILIMPIIGFLPLDERVLAPSRLWNAS